MSEHQLISIVTPAHNEEEALPGLVASVVKTLSGHAHEIIIVDDGSTDGTWSVIQSLKCQFPEVRAVRFTRNFGHQAALLAGLHAAQGDAVITLDSDGQHPVNLLPTLIERWQEGHIIVQGVRIKSANEGSFKRWSSQLFYKIHSTLSGVQVPIGSADFRLIGRPAVDTILRSAGPLPFLRGLIPWLGYDVRYVPFAAERRAAGRPSYTLRKMLRLSLEGLMAFSIIPLRLAITLGLLVSGLSLLYLIYILVVRLGSDNAVAGWASMTGLLSLLGGIQLLTIGIMGEYLGRLFVSNLNRPQFVIREQL